MRTRRPALPGPARPVGRSSTRSLDLATRGSASTSATKVQTLKFRTGTLGLSHTGSLGHSAHMSLRCSRRHTGSMCMGVCMGGARSQSEREPGGGSHRAIRPVSRRCPSLASEAPMEAAPEELSSLLSPETCPTSGRVPGMPIGGLTRNTLSKVQPLGNKGCVARLPGADGIITCCAACLRSLA